jgi:hypothetical protein
MRQKKNFEEMISWRDYDGIADKISIFPSVTYVNSEEVQEIPLWQKTFYRKIAGTFSRRKTII